MPKIMEITIKLNKMHTNSLTPEIVIQVATQAVVKNQVVNQVKVKNSIYKINFNKLVNS